MSIAERIRFSLRIKFLIAIGGLVLLIGTVFFALGFTSLRRSVVRLTVQKNLALVARYASSVENMINMHNELELDDQTSIVSHEEGVVAAYVLDPNGMFVTHGDFNQLGRQKPAYRILRAADSRRPFITAIDGAGRTVWIFSAPVLKIMSAHVEVTPNVIRRPLARFLVEFSLVFGLLLLGGLFLAVRIASVLVRPIRELIRGVEIVSAGDFDYRLPLRSADEIGVLTRGFNRMTAGIREAQALRIQQERIRNELEFAAEIQTKLIPSQPLDYPQYHIEHVYSPAKEIGGDYYDFFPLDSGRLGFVLCDVSGKGVPAAMVMSMLKTIFLALSGRGAGPAETLSVANVLLRRNIRQNVFAAAFYGELDTVNHSLTFAMAGAEKMFQVIATDGSVREWKTPGMPLGLMDDAIFRSEIREERITIGFDDRFLFYTDGLTDVRDAQSGFFGEEGIRKFLSEHVTDPEFCRQLVETTVRFRGSDRQEDDLSFIYLARKSAGV